jgi:hypothetical protein
MWRGTTRLLGSLGALLVVCGMGSASDRLVVHEWGTFTALQNERGNALQYINTDDEPVPPFVHQLGKGQVFKPTEPFGRYYGKGLPIAVPEVVMRLETPVLYFHLPEGDATPRTVDVDVEFHGGWLTQFYPNADAQIHGKKVPEWLSEMLTDKSHGRLSWHGVKVGGTSKGPATTDRVWTAPRAVSAAPVTVQGESEQFLFYRGVAHLNAPLRVVRDAVDPSNLHILGQTDRISPLNGTNTALTAAWLVDVRPDGATAFREVSDLLLSGVPGQHLTTISSTFAGTDFRKGNLAQLRSEMRTALQNEGLFADEAEALLSTWEFSYFQSPGLRLFFMVPRAWTDYYLPLHLSVSADVQRVMVGRIEIVTPEQRARLQKIAKSPEEDLRPAVATMHHFQHNPALLEQYKALASGRGNLADLGKAVPESYKAFVELGRFRLALLLDRSGDPKLAPGLERYYKRLELARDSLAN